MMNSISEVSARQSSFEPGCDSDRESGRDSGDEVNLEEVNLEEGVDSSAVESVGKKSGRSSIEYRKELAAALGTDIFQPNPARMLGYAGCVGVNLVALSLIIFINPTWPVKLLLGMAIGLSNGILGFICHELAHGSILKSRALQNFFGYFGMLPFLVAPTYWRFSHNRLHHGHAQRLIEDPDAFPNLRIYRASKFMRFMYPFTPGSRHKRSAIYFFFWFSFHNIVSQVHLRFRNRIFDGMNHRRASLELAGQIAIVIALAAIAGPANWLWIFIIPLAVQNYMLMSYISTNHNLSPLTTVNDPLVNSLSVTNHPWLEWLHLDFGYHVEHHLYPTMNPKHAKKVHRELVKRYPDLYKIMPKWKAMRELYRTPRIYKNSRELIHPETMETFPTL